jgi:MFS family permease
MCLSSFFQYLTHYTLIVALPVFVVQILKLGDNQVGLVLTFFQIGAVLFRPFAGKWMDDFEKKKVLFVSLAIFSALCFMYLGVQTFFFLLVLRFFHGAGFATGTTATATMVAVFSPPDRIGEGVGYLAVFTSIAMVVGPFIGLKSINDYSFTLLFALCALFGLLAFLCGNMSSVPKQKVESQSANKDVFSWKDLFEPHALPIALCGGLLSFVYSSLLGFLPLYAHKIGMMDMASYFFAVYALAIILSRPIIGKLFDQVGINKIVYVSAFAYFVGMVGLSQANNPVQFLVAGAIIGLGFGGLNPSFQALAVLAAPKNKCGLATSTYFLSMDIGVGLGSFVLGLVVAFTNYRVMYLICSIMVVFITVLFYFIKKRSIK